MDNLFKKLVYTGVGVVAQAKERLEETITNLVEEEKLSTKEGKKIVDEFLKSSEGKKGEVEREFNSMVERLVRSFSFATRKDVKEVEDRIALLEAMVARMEGPLAIAAPAESEEDKKAAPKRRTTRSQKEDGEAKADEQAE